MNSSVAYVDITLRDHILTIRLDREERKNALNHAMYWAMAEAVEGADDNSDVRVILIHGSDDCFSSGNDIADFVSSDLGDYSEVPAVRFLKALYRSTKPIIAAVAGPAVGVGTTMLLHCDMVYAANNSNFKLPFTQLGLVPEAASSLLLPRLAGHQKAAELLMLGESFDAQTAEEIGLVNEIHNESVVAHARLVARKLAKLPPTSVQATKKLLRDPLRAAMLDAHDQEQEYFAKAMASAESAEALSAFMEKRAPVFKV
jgi:enoyl-CoA hydratase/carnithine racemase